MEHDDRPRNHLLRSLPPSVFARLSRELKAVDLPRGFVLSMPGAPIADVYFLVSGLASVVSVSPKANMVEAGVFGRDGLGPVAAVLGVDRTPQRCMIQLPGSGYSLSPAALAAAMEDSRELRRILAFYLHVFTMQTSYTALSNGIHVVEERLARWLLMCHDRCDGDDVDLTHNFLAIMLAVRRPSVTVALHILEGHRFIRSDRGRIVIRDRPALEAFAADAYGVPEAEYSRLLGSMGSSRGGAAIGEPR